MDDERHEHISRLAHEIWEKEGRPEGQDAEHWQAARRLIEASETEGMTVLSDPAAPGDIRSADDRRAKPGVPAAALHRSDAPNRERSAR
ncbi:DUF2934 domain-containing protein [Cereibacter changlensis]|uniref:DUF2934 domain-containing protein n=1 Tax=Cereibacter changlensis TaxID=402884 RepID=A0A4U0Z3R5_9RHOB|nr:DUF2934 domain-containing protein [Cereibacter changlensis]TKA96103.1 DUF2934 domain-containing protein [Cereibacter changlensis]